MSANVRYVLLLRKEQAGGFDTTAILVKFAESSARLSTPSGQEIIG